MIDAHSFGEWIKQHRQSKRLTQKEIAASVYCSVAMIKKIEADERHPSLELAEALAAVLEIPASQRVLFVQCARGERSVDQLSQAHSTLSPSFAPPLPQSQTPFIGRQAELRDITDKLNQPDCRLLTLLGSGGIGKTRLAIEIARAIQVKFDDGALFVPLSTVTDAAEIPLAIARALHQSLAGSAPPSLQIQRLLRRRHLLLVLDNVEQLITGAKFLSELMAAAPDLKLIVTSRERLNLVEEWLYPVPALAEATALFEATARRIKQDFDLDAEKAAVDQICQCVGEHPLAVELAASLVRFMSCQQIVTKIKENLDFLATSSRNAPDRHLSLLALFDHSWVLLTPAEQQALARLTVFQGGFVPAEVEMVTGATWPILLGLVDKSLVEAKGDNRFDLHPLIHQYAAAKLAEVEEKDATRQAHFESFCALAHQLKGLYIGPQALTSARRAEQEYHNFQAALSWGLANQQSEAVLKLLHDIFEFWLSTGHWQEGERWSVEAVALAAGEDSAHLSLVLCQLAIFRAMQGRFPEAAAPAQQAYQMAQRLEDPWPLVHTLQLQGQSRRDKAGALAAFEEAVAICREQTGDRRFDTYHSSLLCLQGDRLMNFGLVSEAKPKFEESLARCRELGDVHYIVYPLGNLGRLALREGDLRKAYDLISESVSIIRAAGNTASIGDWLFRLGQTLLYLGDLDGAETNLQEAMHIYTEVGNQSGIPTVLSTLALVALARKNETLARNLIQESMSDFRSLQEAMQSTDVSATILEFRDTAENLLQAGVVAHALKEWDKSIGLFRFVENNIPSYVAIRPLQEKVSAAKTDMETNLSPMDFSAAVTKGEKLTLDALLIW